MSTDDRLKDIDRAVHPPALARGGGRSGLARSVANWLGLGRLGRRRTLKDAAPPAPEGDSPPDRG